MIHQELSYVKDDIDAVDLVNIYHLAACNTVTYVDSDLKAINNCPFS